MANLENRIATLFTEKVLKNRIRKTTTENIRNADLHGNKSEQFHKQ